jgi:S-adenosylmethionine decarboxylase proenzyme
MTTRGTHILCELSGCTPCLDDQELVEQLLCRVARDAGAEILHSWSHKFVPSGVSAIVAIAESHLSIHTWPEEQYAAVDFYSCGEIDTSQACEYLSHYLGATGCHTITIERGVGHRGSYTAHLKR